MRFVSWILSKIIRKSIKIEQLVEIVGNTTRVIGKGSFITEIHQYCPETADGKRASDFDAYICRVQGRIEEMKLNNYITVERSEESLKAKIKIRKLKIKFEKSENIFLDGIKRSANEFGKICINFKNNKFVSLKKIPICLTLEYDKYSISEILFHRNKFYNVNLEIKGETHDRNIVKFNSNKFTNLIISSSTHVFLHGRNIIESIITHHIAIRKLDKVGYIYFSSRQRIDKSGKYAEQHRENFLKLQKEAFERQDFPQVKILQVEIMKCEHHILCKEGWLKGNRQDRIIMSWSYLVSRYGTSWVLPLSYLLGMNLFCSILIYLFYDWTDFWMIFLEKDFWMIFLQEDFWIVFLQFLNPLVKPAELSGVTDPTSFLLSVYTLQKTLYVLFVYELVKAFRRFAIK